MPRAVRRIWIHSLIAVACLTLALLPFAPNPPSIVHAQTAATDHLTHAGDQSCLPCHKAESSTYLHTAHHLSAQLPSHTSILGAFTPPKNTLHITQQKTSDLAPNLLFRMDATPTRFTETAILSTPITSSKRTESIDLVIGSGTRGQTYLYWSSNKIDKSAKLFELPISYWTDGHQWINSPGYQDGTADFSRPVNARCLECHTAYIRTLSPDPDDYLANSFDHTSLTPGIACENCHGPAAAHVAFEQANAKLPAAARHSISQQEAPTILNPAHFPRDRQVDQCALCHDGTQSQQLQPAFTYLPNQPLDRYLTTDATTVSDTPDVHGNQVALLKKSRCYLSSPTMSCGTCHNPHAPERPAAAYSDRCLTCHQWQACGVSRTLGPSITHDCISCHMPLQQTAAIVSITSGRITHASIRTHWIKIYPQPSKN